MNRLKITKKFYNGIINPFSTISNSIEYEIKENTIIATIEREYYDGKCTRSIIKGSFDLVDNYYDNEKYKLEDFYEFKEQLEEWCSQIQENYKDEYFINALPDSLDPLTVEIDNKEYKYANKKCSDDEYFIPFRILRNDPLIQLSHKLLSKILPLTK